MKNLIFIFAAFILVSCATTKTSTVEVTPVGNWDFSVTGTPEGDFKGVMNIMSADKSYTAKLNLGNGEQNIERFTWNQTDKKIAGDINYSGYNVFLQATQAGEEMTGTMSAEGMSFPFLATRKK